MLDVLGFILAAAATAPQPFDPEILGVRLGMPYSQAAELARAEIKPDLVFAITTQEPDKGYPRATMFFSYRDSQRLVVYTGDNGRVVGVERVIEIGNDAARERFRTQITEKYGRPRRSGKEALAWWSGKAALPSYCRSLGWQPSDARLMQGSEPDGRIELARQNAMVEATTYATSLSLEPRAAPGEQKFDVGRCGPVLEVRIDRTLSCFGEGLFQFLLYDHAAYMKSIRETPPSPSKNDPLPQRRATGQAPAGAVRMPAL
jgi:hypothetical protein